MTPTENSAKNTFPLTKMKERRGITQKESESFPKPTEIQHEVQKAELLSLLACPERRLLLRELQNQHSPSSLSAKLNYRKGRVWYHLRILKQFGLIKQLVRGNSLINKGAKAKYSEFLISERGFEALKALGEL